MTRVLPRGLPPRSLLGQVMLALALGLLAAQAVSGLLLYRAAEQRREAEIASSIAFRLMTADEREQRRDMRMRVDAPRPGGMRRMPAMERQWRGVSLRAGIERTAQSPLHPGEVREPGLESALADVLAQQGYVAADVAITRRRAGSDSFIAARPRLQQRFRDPDWPNRRLIVAGIRRDPGQQWLVVHLAEPRRPHGALGTILLQTAVIFAVLVTLLFLLMRRITRPLAQLTQRLGDFARNPDRAQPLAESGPDDMRRLIAAHNAMVARIGALIAEKDVMLGAIGHDLKTPLAALRVRIESVPDPAQRDRMAQTIEDIASTLDDILNLARVGRPGDPLEQTDLAALVASVVEEYEDLGEPVVLGDTARIALPLRPTWLRRAIRNLIGNALRYGAGAQVTLVREGAVAVIRIDDQGPGIPPDRIEVMLEPFQRGEMSRNRATGGAGLGLTLTRAIAEQHGGSLELVNRAEGGLRAEIRLPLD